jgi:hypothetical protein
MSSVLIVCVQCLSWLVVLERVRRRIQCRMKLRAGLVEAQIRSGHSALTLDLESQPQTEEQQLFFNKTLEDTLKRQAPDSCNIFAQHSYHCLVAHAVIHHCDNAKVSIPPSPTLPESTAGIQKQSHPPFRWI